MRRCYVDDRTQCEVATAFVLTKSLSQIL